MIHAPVPRLLCCLLLLTALGCGDPSEGDDLPPGAFTSGPDDGTVGVGDATTTAGSEDSEGTTTAATTTSTDSDSSDTGPVVLSFAEHIDPILQASCTDPSCHDSDGPINGLDLQSPGTLERICGVYSLVVNMVLVDCEGADPQNSWIFRKLEGTQLDVSPGGGGRMPPAPLPDDDIATIEAWIEGGALP